MSERSLVSSADRGNQEMELIKGELGDNILGLPHNVWRGAMMQKEDWRRKMDEKAIAAYQFIRVMFGSRLSP